MENPLIAITPRFTLTGSCSTSYAPSKRQLDLIKNYSGSIEPCAKTIRKIYTKILA